MSGGRISRRGFIGISALAAAGVTATVAGFTVPSLLRPGEPGALLRSGRPLPARFARPLPVPPVLKAVATDATTDYYEITQQPGVLRIFDGVDTPAWTFGGSFPGPTLVSRSGRRTVVRHTNRLAHPTVVHLHGGHTPHDSDGYPGDQVLPLGSAAPGGGMSGIPAMAGMPAVPGDVVVGTREYTYPMNQRAATLWYHDHRMGFTGPSVWYGLAGFHLVHDDEEDALPLPRGDRDIPLMITDRSFDAAGRLQYPSIDLGLMTPGVPSTYANGVLGDVVLVNGAPWPVLAVRRARYRLRMLNASNARRYQLSLDPPPPGGGGFVQIGSGGGLLDRPVPHDRIEMASAERFDVVVDFGAYPAGTRVVLRNGFDTGSAAEVMAFDVGPDRDPDDVPLPDALVTSAALDPAKAAVTRDFLFQNTSQSVGWTINGRPYDPAHPVAFPRLGDIEVWRFVTDVHHSVHMHLEQFQVIGRNSGRPGPYDLGWKDTIDLRPAEEAAVVVRFTDYAGRFLLHCHNLEHEDMAMMADFITA